MSSSTAQRLAGFLWRDLQLRAGFRDVIDQINDRDGHLIIEYWASRIDEEIGDNRFIAALEEIAANPNNDAYIAKRALGPAKHEQAAKLGITQFAADGEAHRVEQLTFDSQPPAPSPDDFM